MTGSTPQEQDRGPAGTPGGPAKKDATIHSGAARRRTWPSIVGAGGAFIVLAGIGLPMAAIVVETGGRVCASTFFDPLPTWWHVALYGLIPLSCFVTLLAASRALGGYRRYLGWLNGAAAARPWLSPVGLAHNSGLGAAL